MSIVVWVVLGLVVVVAGYWVFEVLRLTIHYYVVAHAQGHFDISFAKLFRAMLSASIFSKNGRIVPWEELQK